MPGFGELRPIGAILNSTNRQLYEIRIFADVVVVQIECVCTRGTCRIEVFQILPNFCKVLSCRFLSAVERVTGRFPFAVFFFVSGDIRLGSVVEGLGSVPLAKRFEAGTDNFIAGSVPNFNTTLLYHVVNGLFFTYFDYFSRVCLRNL